MQQIKHIIWIEGKLILRVLRPTRPKPSGMPPHTEPTKSDEPFADVTLFKYKAPAGKVIQIGPVRLDILEDGRTTD